MSVARSVRSLPPGGTSRGAAGARRMQRPMAAASEPSENPVRQTGLFGALAAPCEPKKATASEPYGPRYENCCSEPATIATQRFYGALKMP